MKSQNISTYLILLLFTTIQILVLSPVEAFANTNPVVTNVSFTIDGTTVTVTYDVADAEEDVFTIYMEVSEDGGTTWDYDYGATTGDIGSGIAEGTNKTITWQYSGGNAGMMKIKLLADDVFGDQIYYSRKIYNTVTIGSQVWLKENLDVGVIISGSSSSSNNGIVEKYCYNNDPNNCVTYGGLYRWDEAMEYVTTNGSKGICPSDWHIATKTEYEILGDEVGDRLHSWAFSGGNSLKAVGQGSGAGLGINTSGFSALLSGHRVYFGCGFSDLNSITYFWTSTESGSKAYYVNLLNDRDDVWFKTFYLKSYYFSVRCVKN